MERCETVLERLIIIGAGGHGKVVADIAVKNGYSDIAFLDDNATGDCVGFPIIGKRADAEAFYQKGTKFVIAVGNNQVRKSIAEAMQLNWATLVHPSAQIALGVTLGEGTVVMAGAVLNACATVGKHSIINTCAVIEHDNVIEDYVHISPHVALGGAVRIGEGTHIGIGATVKNNTNICNDSKIGAGAVVVKNITESATYIGIPAQKVGGGVKGCNFTRVFSGWRCVA